MTFANELNSSIHQAAKETQLDSIYTGCITLFYLFFNLIQEVTVNM